MKRRRAAGFSLVELMVALAISLAMTALMGSIWANNRRTFKAQDNRSRIQENARFALQLMSRELRLAGYKGLGNEGTDASLLFGGSTAAALAGTNDTTSVTVASGVALSSDTVTVAFYGAGSGSSGDGSVTNCFGTSVGASVQVQDTFSVAVDAASGLPSLLCRSVVGATTTLAVVTYSVEALQVLYGEETDGLASGIPNHFVQAGAVGNFSNVTQARISLLMRGEDRTLTSAPGTSNALRAVASTAPYGAKFYHFGQVYYSTDTTGDTGAISDVSAVQDGRQRALFGTTVELRNRTN